MKTWLRYSHAQSGEAWRIATAVAATVPMVEEMSDEKRRMTPRQIASFACDVAQAMRDELVKREWAEEMDPPSK